MNKDKLQAQIQEMKVKIATMEEELATQKEITTIQISDKQDATYTFKKPDFECELIAIIGEYCIGYYEVYYRAVKGKQKIPTFWNLKTGNCYKGGGVSNSAYSLIPTKEKLAVNKEELAKPETFEWEYTLGGTYLMKAIDVCDQGYYGDNENLLKFG